MISAACCQYSYIHCHTITTVTPSLTLSHRLTITLTLSHRLTITLTLSHHPHTIPPSLLSHHHYCHTITTVTLSPLSHHHYCHTITTVTLSLLSQAHSLMMLASRSTTDTPDGGSLMSRNLLSIPEEQEGANGSSSSSSSSRVYLPIMKGTGACR